VVIDADCVGGGSNLQQGAVDVEEKAPWRIVRTSVRRTCQVCGFDDRRQLDLRTRQLRVME